MVNSRQAPKVEETTLLGREESCSGCGRDVCSGRHRRPDSMGKTFGVRVSVRTWDGATSSYEGNQ